MGDAARVQIAVIGSGPGGALTACLLAEAGRDVLLLEEAPAFVPSPPFSVEEMTRHYRHGGVSAALGRPPVAYVEGRCVGGGSEINSGLFHRTPPEILEEWRKEFRLDAATPADLAPHFEACERELGVSLLDVPASEISLRLRRGAEALGWQSQEVPRWFSRGSDGRLERKSMSRSYLPRLAGAGGRLRTGARVRRMSRTGGHWRLQLDDGRVEADTVFVCGGAIQSPALLRRSGFRRGIGDGLRLHPTVKVAAAFAEEVNGPDAGVGVHQVKQFAPAFSFGCSISSPPYLALSLLEHPEALKQVPATWKRMGVYYAMTRGGRGTVRVLPFFRDPLVRYRLSPADRVELREALVRLCECLFAAGAVRLHPGVASWPALASAAEARGLPPAVPADGTSLMSVHVFSTLPLGEDPLRCPVDSFGRFREAPGLHVADASLLCGPPGVNPQGTVLAFARRNALRFLERPGP